MQLDIKKIRVKRRANHRLVVVAVVGGTKFQVDRADSVRVLVGPKS